jgi:hypothetical protein
VVYNDVHPPAARPPPRARLVVFGDSFVEGVHVKTDELYHRRLEADLRRSAPAGVDVEAIAYAWSGWGQVQELEALRSRGARYVPEVVVLGFLGSNDVRNNQPELERLATEQNGLFMMAANHLAFRRGLYFASFLADRFNRLERRLGGDPLDLDVYKESPRNPELWKDAWACTDALLAQFAADCARIGSKLVVVIFTSEKEVRGIGEPVGRLVPGCDFRLPARRMLELCRQRAIPCLDLAPRFVSRGGADLERLHLQNDGHWSRIGHRWAAEETARFLRQETNVWGDVVARVESARAVAHEAPTGQR